MKSSKISGVIVATITPFDLDFSIDINGAKWLYNKLKEFNVDGLFISGTTGEWPSLKIEERILLAKIAKETVGDKIKVLLGITGLSPLETIENAKKAEDSEADFIVTTPPLYYRPNSKELAEYFIKVSEAADKPLIIYTNPGNVGYNVPLDSIIRAVEESSLISGIKATTPDLHYLFSIITEVKEIKRTFAVLAGYGEYLLDALIAGGDGAVDALSNVAPGLVQKVYNYWKKGDLQKAIEIHRKLVKLATILRQLKPKESSLKTILTELGAPLSNVVRPPLDRIDLGSLTIITERLCSEFKEYLLIKDGCLRDDQQNMD